MMTGCMATDVGVPTPAAKAYPKTGFEIEQSLAFTGTVGWDYGEPLVLVKMTVGGHQCPIARLEGEENGKVELVVYPLPCADRHTNT